LVILRRGGKGEGSDRRLPIPKYVGKKKGVKYAWSDKAIGNLEVHLPFHSRREHLRRARRSH